MRKKIVSVALGALIGVPLALYAVGHPSKPAELRADNNVVVYMVQASAQENINETVMAAVQEVTTEVQALYSNVPLSEDLKEYIIKLCESKHIAPALVFAIIDRESSFNEKAIGDSEHSFGLMQIQPRWSKERMTRLDCLDLLNPYQNVAVGIDILSTYFEKYEDIAYVLMAYNGGESYAENNMKNGIYETDYTRYVLEKSKEYSCDIAR